ncbi:MAG: trypsin-like serine protease [Myxococcales bacterium]|nr:S1 family peptidase [Myxococcota bacterium]MDW8284210.1 trypsin-like serine protease [Myxococcales bacterium]
MRRTRILSCTVGLVLSSCGPADQPLDDELARVNIKEGTPADEFPTACMIDIFNRDGKLVSFCSGALIAPGAVLTAGHCVAGFHSFRVYCPYLHRESVGTGEACPSYHVGLAGTIAPTSDDIGLVFLDARIPARYPVLRSTQLPDDTLVVNVGRVRDGVVSKTEMYRSAPVRIRDGRSINFPRYYVSVDKIQNGDSGGPTYRYQGPVPELVAVNSGAGGGIAVLARVDLALDWIRNRVSARSGWSLPPGYQPLTPRPPSPVDLSR